MLNELIIDPELIAAQIKKHEKAETPEHLTFGVNIYTDGGCRNGDTGWGVHGFVYTNTPSKTGCGVSGHTATNRGYIVNTKLAHVVECVDIFTPKMVYQDRAMMVQPFGYFDGSGSLLDSTNNVAETLAFTRGLDIAARLYEELKITHVHFKIDSKYVINNILTRFDIIANDWCNKSGPIANKDYWVEAFSKLEALSNLPIIWTVEWVKGHSDCFGNIQADKLATMGTIAAGNEYVYEKMAFQPAAGRWGATSVDTKSNPALYFMVDSKWYYDPLMEHEERDDGLIPLFLGNHEDHEHAGQPDAKTSMSIALMKDPPKHLVRLVQVAERLNRIENGYENRSAFHGTVNNILKPEFEDQVMSDGDAFMMVNSNTKTALTYDGKEVLRSFNPPLLSIKMMNRFTELHTILDRVVSGKMLPTDYLNELTDKFYSTTMTTKNKPMVKAIIPNDPSIKVNVKTSVPVSKDSYDLVEAEITLSYGITAPRHRVFGGVKDFDPKVYVLTTFEPTTGFRYYTLMKLNTGEWGIWTNPDANLRLF